ncbi:MAG: hypothetical protein UY49_C0004G0012 [Microgenomates group bacterium GW2011_GWC1_49_7]|nr:MAG: hypothetical protein UY49_C0004G0012 [Microgenomates group bacterium GW2011_GWC1_49_7]
MRKIVALVLIIVLFLFFASPAYALKKRIRAPKPAGTGYSSVRLSRPTHSTVVTFIPKTNVKRFDYVLSYGANGIAQGVVGSFIPAGGGTQSRDLYFGTCSHGVCTPHYGITGATLTITTTLNGGASYIKRYRFKSV